MMLTKSVFYKEYYLNAEDEDITDDEQDDITDDDQGEI
jgi:hypothetical protein